MNEKLKLTCSNCSARFLEWSKKELCWNCRPHQVGQATIANGEATWQSLAPAAVKCQDDLRKPDANRIFNDLAAFCSPKSGLFISGPSRAGKTWLAWRTLRVQARAGWTIAELRACDLHGPTESAERIRELKLVGTLLVDDIDKAVFNERNTQLLFSIIDSRVNSRLPTIITSNVRISGFADLIPPNMQRFAPSFIGRFNEQYKEIVFK